MDIKVFNSTGTITANSCMETKIPGIVNCKPSIAVLNDEEMLLFTCHPHYEEAAHGGPCQVWHSVMFSSHDGGKTWGGGKHMPFRGYEPSASVIDGIIFVQTHLHPNMFNTNSSCIALLYRSDDAGKTWTETEINPDFVGVCDKSQILCMARNLIMLPDKTIIGFVWGNNGFQCRLKSDDAGKSWQADRVSDDIKRDKSRALMCESVSFVTPSGRLMSIARVDLSMITDERIPNLCKAEPFDTDEGDGMLLIESKDNGLSWHAVRGLGYGAMMYPSIVYTNRNDFVLTYTQRNARVYTPYQHPGVQAVTGTECENGSFEIDFDNNIMILDDKSPDEIQSSDGYGMTYMLGDGTLITPYCFAAVTEEYNKIIKSGECYKSDDIYYNLYSRTGKADPEKGPDLDWWRNMSFEWKVVVIHECASQLGLFHYESRVLKWRVEKHEK